MVQHGGCHGRRGAQRAGAWLDALLDADLCCTAVLPDAVVSIQFSNGADLRRPLSESKRHVAISSEQRKPVKNARKWAKLVSGVGRSLSLL